MVGARHGTCELARHGIAGERHGTDRGAAWARQAMCELALIHTFHAVLCRGLRKSLSERHGRRTAWARRGHGMACVNETWSHCENQKRKTKSKPLAARHGHDMLCVN